MPQRSSSSRLRQARPLGLSTPNPEEAEKGSSTQQSPKQEAQSDLKPGVATRGSCHAGGEDLRQAPYQPLWIAKAFTKSSATKRTAMNRLSKISLAITPSMPACSRN